MKSLSLLLIGVTVSGLSIYFSYRFLMNALGKKQKSEKKQIQEVLYLLGGFSQFYFWLALFLVGLLFACTGAGLIDLRIL